MEKVIAISPDDAIRLAHLLTQLDLSDQSQLADYRDAWAGRLAGFGHYWTLKNCVPASYWTDYQQSVFEIAAMVSPRPMTAIGGEAA